FKPLNTSALPNNNRPPQRNTVLTSDDIVYSIPIKPASNKATDQTNNRNSKDEFKYAKLPHTTINGNNNMNSNNIADNKSDKDSFDDEPAPDISLYASKDELDDIIYAKVNKPNKAGDTVQKIDF
ncbi:hypothetical protein, partial [Salmonella sp. s51228]|uniref:hypothetical protein n=1 Tax=Salmonella sp. s51228 TaxID=3159652 RepID=UPI00397F71A6